MSINNFIYDIRILKYKCVLAYFHFQLEEAQRMTDSGKGENCVRNSDYVKNNIVIIKDKIEELNCTYKDILLLVKANPFLIPYYNTIGTVVKKHFPKNSPWIPSFLMIEVLRLFEEKNYNLFPDIDFWKLQEEFQRYEKRKDSNLPIHFRCAEDIFLSLEKVKIFKKKRKK